MEPGLESLYLEYNKEIGRLFGQEVNIYRPPGGSTVDQSPTLVTSGSFKIEKSGPILAQPGLYNIEYYSIFGDFTLLNPGDVLIPTDSDSSTPVTTFLSKSPGEEAKSFRTNRLCKLITNYSPESGAEQVVYSNVRFEFLPTGFPSNQFADLVLGRGVTPTMSVIMYKLPNMQQINVITHDILGMRLIHTGGVQEVVYTIKLVEEIEPMIHLVLQQE